METAFDPLSELYGMWTTELAEQYLPIPHAPLVGRYECLDGYLIMSRRADSSRSFAAAALGHTLIEPARAAGYRAYLALNVVLHPSTWVVPDLVVLKDPIKGLTWVPADKVLIAIEFVSGSRMDRPIVCVEAGILYFMRVEINEDDVRVELLKLADGEYVTHAKALAGQRFETELPFPISFDPGELLEP